MNIAGYILRARDQRCAQHEAQRKAQQAKHEPIDEAQSNWVKAIV